MRAFEFGAAPQIAEPISKMRIAVRNDILSGKYLYTFPQQDWKDPMVTKNAEEYHPTLSRP